MALADRMAALFVKRLGSAPILGVKVDSKILHRGTAQFSGSPQMFGSLNAQAVVTLVTPSHMLLIESGRLLFAAPWTCVTSLSEIESSSNVWLLEVEFPGQGAGAIGLQPRNFRETNLFFEFIETARSQTKIR